MASSSSSSSPSSGSNVSSASDQTTPPPTLPENLQEEWFVNDMLAVLRRFREISDRLLDIELDQWKRDRWYALRDAIPCTCRQPVTTAAAILFIVLCSYAFDGVGQFAAWIFNHHRPPFPLDASTTTFGNLTNFTATVKATHERLNTPPHQHQLQLQHQNLPRDPHRQEMDNLIIAYAVRDYAIAWMVAVFGATGCGSRWLTRLSSVGVGRWFGIRSRCTQGSSGA
ncbi:hypothetical protein BJY00DRAFT_250510 [Aspergillus carlsbadensis]|nr:hypothetical protein BJY00DRAFT_250510 [Aspergillus carlsbadensis]